MASKVGDMMQSTNEYYDLINDEDLNRHEGYNSMILACKECGAMFRMKACGNRTLFEWFGYHPTDGNCQVISDEFRLTNGRLVSKCNCKDYPKRITSKNELDKVIARIEIL